LLFLFLFPLTLFLLTPNFFQAEVAAYGGDDRKRKRAKKDPNAPKRALSAFFFFSNEKRNEIQVSGIR